jgi:hypothetical protein
MAAPLTRFGFERRVEVGVCGSRFEEIDDDLDIVDTAPILDDLLSARS